MLAHERHYEEKFPRTSSLLFFAVSLLLAVLPCQIYGLVGLQLRPYLISVVVLLQARAITTLACL